MKLFNTEMKKMPVRAQIARWVAQGVVLGVVLPGSAFAVAPLGGTSGTETPSTTSLVSNASNCLLRRSDQPFEALGIQTTGAIMGLSASGFWLTSSQKPITLLNCTTNTTIATITTDERPTTTLANNSTYVVAKTVAGASVGFLKLTTNATAEINSCAEVDAPVASVCNPTAAASTPANIPVFGPLGLIASLGGLLWFGRRRRKD